MLYYTGGITGFTCTQERIVTGAPYNDLRYVRVEIIYAPEAIFFSTHGMIYYTPSITKRCKVPFL